MPAIFNDVELFKRWFDLSSATTAGGGINSSILSTVEKLHGILKPFMLRRLKVDVEKNLPLKKE
jgi:ATP-dependent DNA helicase